MSKKGSLFHQFFGSKLSYLEKIQEAVLKQEELLPYSGKAVWSMSLRQTLVRQSRTLITSDEYMVCLDSSEQIFDLLDQHEDMGTEWNLWKLIWNSVINGFCTLLFWNWTWSGVQRNGISIHGPFSEGPVTFGVTLSFTHELEIFVDMHVKWNQSVGMKMVAC